MQKPKAFEYCVDDDLLTLFITKEKLVELQAILKGIGCLVKTTSDGKCLAFSCTFNESEEGEADLFPRWKPLVESTFSAFKWKYKLHEARIPEDFFDSVTEDLMKAFPDQTTPSFHILKSKKNQTVHIVGDPAHVDDISKAITEGIKEMKRVREANQKDTIEVVDCKKRQFFQLLKKLNFEEELRRLHQRVKMKYVDSPNGSIELTGQVQFVKPAADMIYKQLGNLVIRHKKIKSPSLFKFYGKPEVLAAIEGTFPSLKAIIEVAASTVSVCAPTQGEAATILDAFFHIVKEDFILLNEPAKIAVMESHLAEWKQPLEKMKEKYGETFEWEAKKRRSSLACLFQVV